MKETKFKQTLVQTKEGSRHCEEHSDVAIQGGFKMTEVGMMPSDWSVEPLANIANTASGGTPSRSNEAFYKGSIKWFTTTELKDCNLYDSVEHISKQAVECSSAKIFPKNTLLMAMYGATIGKLGLLKCDAATNQACCAIFPKKTDVLYLYYFLLHNRENIIAMGCGAGQPNVSQEIVKKINIPIPPTIEEQQRIANALSDVDTLIANLEKLIAKKKNIKQGAMQQLLTGKKRLPGFGSDNGHTDWFTPNGVHEKSIKIAKVVRPESIRVKDKEQCAGFKMTELGEIPEDWEVKSVSSLLKIGHGKDYKNLKKGAVPVFGTGGYMTSVNDYLYDGDTVCIGRKGTIDKPFFHTGKIWTVDTLFYTYDFVNCIPKFIYYAFCLVDWLSMNEASGVPSLTSKNIEDVFLCIPSNVSEQTAIVNVLSDMDAEIEKLSAKLQKYHQLKTAMMQQLLTGKIRLV